MSYPNERHAGAAGIALALGFSFASSGAEAVQSRPFLPPGKRVR